MATKAEKQAAKAEKQAEKAEVAQVKAAQKAETTLLKSQGATKAQIKAETKANKTELAQAKATLAAPGKQTVTPAGQATFLSQPSTYSGLLADNVQKSLQNAAAKYDSLGITNASVSGKTKVGLGIDKIVDYDLGKAGSSATKTIERAQQFVGKSFTADELAAQGIKIKPVKGADGLFQYKTGEPGNNVYTFFRKDENGNLVGTGVNRTSTPQDDGGFFQSGLGQALAIGGMLALTLTPGGQAFAAQLGSTLSGGALAANSLAAKALGVATLRGVSTGVITGDIEKGLIAGALSGAGSVLNISGELGNIFDSVGLGDFKDAFGVLGGNVSEASFAAADAAQLAAQGIGAGQIADILVQQGGLGLEAAINAANLAIQGASAADIASTIRNSTPTGAFDVGGAQGTGLLDGVSDGLPVDAGAADITQLAGDVTTAGLEQATQFPDGLSYDPGAGYGTGTAGGMLGAEGLMGSAAGGTFGMGTAAGILGTGLTAKELLTGANTARQIYNAVTGGGGAGGGTAGGGGAGGGVDGFLSGLLGNVPGLAGTAIDYAALQRISDEATGLGRQLGREAAQIGTEAQTPFTPYTLTTGAGSATISPGSATATAAAPYEALRQQALTQAQQTLGAINPAQATQQLYANLEALAAPTRQREQEQLLGRLGSAGLLGIGRNLPTAGGGIRAVNPFQESLLAAQERGRIEQALQAQQFGTSEAARQQALAQNLQAQAMGIDRQTMEQLATARTLGVDERTLAQQNARLRAQTALAGLELRAPYEQLGLLGQIRGIEAAAGGARGLLGLPTQPGNTSSGGGGLLGQLFNSLLNQGMSAEQAADYVNNISSGLDISGESEGTQNLINQLQEYGIF